MADIPVSSRPFDIEDLAQHSTRGLPPLTLPKLPPPPQGYGAPPRSPTFDELPIPVGFGALPPPPITGTFPPLQSPVPAPIPPPAVDLSAPTREVGKWATRKLAILVFGTTALVSVIVAGSVFVFGAAPSPVAITSPSEANSKVFAAAVASGTVHYASVSSGMIGTNPVTVTQSGDAGHGEGVQFTISAVGDNEVIVIGSKVYMRADATMLENMLGYSVGEAAPYVNKWIAFTPSDPLYQAVAAGVTTNAIWGNQSDSPTDQLPQIPESVSGLSTLNGKPVQSVRYSLHGTNRPTVDSYSGTETIVFSASDPHLPSLLTEHMSETTAQGVNTEENQVTFSQWGERVSADAPTVSIPFSSLPAPSSTI